MPKVHVVTNEGELVDTIEIPEDMNLDHVYGRMSLGADIVDAVQRARQIEKRNGEENSKRK